MKIEITAEDREWLLERAVSKVLYGNRDEDDEESGYHSGIEAELKRRVNERLDGLATKAFEDAVTAEVSTRVQKILDEGWPTTNRYGEHKGERVTIRELIMEKLHTKVGDSYRGNQKSLIEHLVGESVTGALGKELAAELDRAKAEIRKAVDGSVKEKLNEALRAALGLGR